MDKALKNEEGRDKRLYDRGFRDALAAVVRAARRARPKLIANVKKMGRPIDADCRTRQVVDILRKIVDESGGAVPIEECKDITNDLNRRTVQRAVRKAGLKTVWKNGRHYYTKDEEQKP